MMQVTKIRKNIMGTISFHAKFKGMRKEQEFIVYPNPEKELTIQSKNRFGYVKKDGSVKFATNCPYGAVFNHRPHVVDNIDNIGELLDAVRGTASAKAGTSGIVYCDNSKAGSI